MGKKGYQSRRGVGEVDASSRDKSVFFKITQNDYLLLCAAAIAEKSSKTEILIKLIRKNLGKYARYNTQQSKEKLD